MIRITKEGGVSIGFREAVCSFYKVLGGANELKKGDLVWVSEGVLHGRNVFSDEPVEVTWYSAKFICYNDDCDSIGKNKYVATLTDNEKEKAMWRHCRRIDSRITLNSPC